MQVNELRSSLVSTTTAGDTLDYTIYRPFASYSETLSFTSTDGTLTVGDQTFSDDSLVIPIVFKEAGFQSISVTDGNLSVSDTLIVYSSTLELNLYM